MKQENAERLAQWDERVEQLSKKVNRLKQEMKKANTALIDMMEERKQVKFDLENKVNEYIRELKMIKR